MFGRIYEYFLTQFAGQGAHDGGDPAEIDVVVNFLDEAGELKDTMSYREFMDSENEEATAEESAG